MSKPAILVTAALLTLAPALLHAQDPEHEWQKQYQVTGSAALTLETSDAATDIHSCGECKTIRIHIQSGQKLSDFNIEEHQSGDHVYFSLKEKPHIGIHINWSVTHSPQITIETPTALQLDAHSGDGNFTARDLNGDLAIRSGDGSVTLDHVHGALRLTASDGNIDIRNASGTLEARASDGRMKIDGQFTAVQLHTSDGNLEFNLAPGSQLTSASRIESSDGQVSIHVPHDLSADLDVSTSDGKVDCALPLTLDHYNSGQHLHGKLNNGGTPLSVHTSDGNVTIAAL